MSHLERLPSDVVLHHLLPQLDPATSLRLGSVNKHFWLLLRSNDQHWQRYYRAEVATWRREGKLVLYLTQRFGGICGAYWARRRLEQRWRDGLDSWQRVVWQCPTPVGRRVKAVDAGIVAVRLDDCQIALLGDVPEEQHTQTATPVEPTALLSIPPHIVELMEHGAIPEVKSEESAKAAKATSNVTEIASPAKAPAEHVPKDEWIFQNIMIGEKRILAFLSRKKDAPPVLLWNAQTLEFERCIFGGFFKYLRLTDNFLMGLRGTDVDMAAYHLGEPDTSCQRVFRHVDAFVGTHPWREDMYVSYDRAATGSRRFVHENSGKTAAASADDWEGDYANWRIWHLYEPGERYAVDAPPEVIAGPRSESALKGTVLLRGHTISSVHGAQLAGDNLVVLWGSGRDDETRQYVGWVMYCKVNAETDEHGERPYYYNPTHKWIFKSSPYDVIPMPEYGVLVVCIEGDCAVLDTKTGATRSIIHLSANGTLYNLLGPLFVDVNTNQGSVTLVDILLGKVLWTDQKLTSTPGISNSRPASSPSSATGAKAKGIRIPMPMPPQITVASTRILVNNICTERDRVLTIHAPL
ncbi:hypothetical protein THASP1DRAFT_29314 [Thamnocephalis sphaerospora]|uniref:F-box domain-containing protein n=1 Tax=Thamnocephalis sphaerospora TaxID=78915 RepID=A0A4P9XS19_9FUNG|nr:hypothetical protein THASP1DRAFT_29314 [Thamnocephalis sphaerospora]|eukprot:RKP08903.1 hypothetical protein THASP1DRAFT_29314 [Thamnocephalis sphaerospora]